MTLEERIKKYPTVKRGHCQDCGNPWWFDQGVQGFVCTTCYKTHGKSSSEEEIKINHDEGKFWDGYLEDKPKLK